MNLTIKAQPLATILTASFLWIVPQHAWALEGPCHALTENGIDW